MKVDELLKEIIEALESVKAEELISLDVKEKSSITDFLVIATGASTAHLKGLADKVHFDLKKKGVQPLGVEGMVQGDWLLLDYNDIIVHLFTSERRAEVKMEDLFENGHPDRDED